MRQERRQQYIAAFVAERMPHPDDQFVESCQVAGWDLGREIAIAVRQAVARSCGVAADFIRASDGFSKELYLLWDEDSLDSIKFWIDLQERLKLDLPDRDAERIRPPFSGDRSVREMVQNVCEVVGCRITTHWNGPAGRNGPSHSKLGRPPGQPFNADPLSR